MNEIIGEEIKKQEKNLKLFRGKTHKLESATSHIALLPAVFVFLFGQK